MSIIADYITTDKEIQFGKPVFKGSRVPVQSLFWHLEKGYTLDNFLENFPSVAREQAEAVLLLGARIFELPQIVEDETLIRWKSPN